MKVGVRNAVRLVVLLATTPVLLIIFLLISIGICWSTFIDTLKDLLQSWCDGLMECLGRCEEDKRDE